MANWFRRKKESSVSAEPTPQEELPLAEETVVPTALVTEPAPSSGTIPDAGRTDSGKDAERMATRIGSFAKSADDTIGTNVPRAPV